MISSLDPWFSLFFLFFVGWILWWVIASAMQSLIYKEHQRNALSWLWSRSTCDVHGSVLRWYELFPVASWLVWRISWKDLSWWYLLSELVGVGLGMFAVWLLWMWWPPELIMFAWWVSLFAWFLIEADIRWYEVSRSMLWGGFLRSSGWYLWWSGLFFDLIGWQLWHYAVWWAVLLGGFFALLYAWGVRQRRYRLGAWDILVAGWVWFHTYWVWSLLASLLYGPDALITDIARHSWLQLGGIYLLLVSVCGLLCALLLRTVRIPFVPSLLWGYVLLLLCLPWLTSFLLW